MDKNYSLHEMFKNRTGETSDEKVSSFLLDAEKTILSKTNRKTMIDELEDFKLKLAIARYVRQGNEGFSSYTEGGESESYLTEDEILSGVKDYRLTAIGRRIKNEKKSLKTFKHRKYIPIKDNEGNLIENYSDIISKDEALIWPVTSKIQIEMYGLRANDIMNMHYYGDVSMEKHDMIIYENVFYKIISNKKFKRFIALEIERI